MKTFHLLCFLKDGKESDKNIASEKKTVEDRTKKMQKRLQRSRKKSSLSNATKKVEKIFYRSLRKAQVSRMPLPH